MARARYDDDFKHRAIALAVERGPADAAHAVGVKPATLRAWCSLAGVATVRSERTAAATAARKATMEERRTRLADRLLELAEMSADQAGALIGDASLRDLVGAWDYAIKNSQLLSGQATTRTEHASKAEAQSIADEIAARRAKRAA